MRRAARLFLERLEAREVLSWGTYPPLTVPIPPAPQAVTLNNQGDAGGQASITAGQGEAAWYRFTAHVTGSYVISATGGSVSFDAVLGVYHTTGRLMGSNDNASAGTKDAGLTFVLQAGTTYLLGVSNKTGTPLGSYFWLINGPSDPPAPAANHVLYLNFDGATLTNADLARYSRNGSDWNYRTYDAEGDGIRVQGFDVGRADREQIIASIIRKVQADVSPFGIVVRRTTGKAVEGVGATTVFVGMDNINGQFAGIASGVDFGNDDVTDVAFVRNYFPNDPAATSAQFMADLILHEAGHTWGLAHVSSTNSHEAMGSGYSNGDYPGIDVAFVNQSFAVIDPYTIAHGRATQNSYLVMYQTFVLNQPPKL